MRPDFKTQIFESLSGKESRIKFRQFPKYTFKLSFEYLAEDLESQDLQTLMGFMLQTQGMYGAFLYSHPADNRATKKHIGTGDGVKTVFQLTRQYGGIGSQIGIVEQTNSIVLNFLDDGTDPILYFDDVVRNPLSYDITDTGLVTFYSPPASGVVVTSSHSYYYKVRFSADGYDFTQLMSDIYECRDIEFVGSVRDLI